MSKVKTWVVRCPEEIYNGLVWYNKTHKSNDSLNKTIVDIFVSLLKYYNYPVNEFEMKRGRPAKELEPEPEKTIYDPTIYMDETEKRRYVTAQVLELAERNRLELETED